MGEPREDEGNASPRSVGSTDRVAPTLQQDAEVEVAPLRRRWNQRGPRPERSSGAFPTFVWDEPDPCRQVTGDWEPLTPRTAEECFHASTRIPGLEGVMPDTGAVNCLTGSEWVDRMETLVAFFGYKVLWQMLQIPQNVSGVGDRAKTCTQRAVVPIGLENGDLSMYCPSVIPQSGVPPLLGLRTMAALHVYFGTELGQFIMVPKGTDDQIVWPAGTKIIQCKRAPSGHWLLIASAFAKKETDGATAPASSSSGSRR